jgi:hypothetical protein
MLARLRRVCSSILLLILRGFLDTCMLCPTFNLCLQNLHFRLLTGRDPDPEHEALPDY